MFLHRGRRVCIGVILSVFVFFIKEAESQGAQPSEEVASHCETPRKEKGICVLYRACPELLAMLMPDTRTSASIQYVKQSTCGSVRRMPKLCCPLKAERPVKPPVTPEPRTADSCFSGPKSSPPTATPLPEMVEQPVDVSKSPKLALLPLRVCGPSGEAKIKGGKKADIMAYPWMALLGYETFGDERIGYHCAGTLINERYILTAAHCVTKLLPNTKLISVRLGDLHIGNVTDCTEDDGEKVCAGPAEDYAVEEIIPHPLYNASKITNDVALIRLNATVKFKRHIKPICLPIGPEQSRSFSGRMILTGWGITEKGFRSQHLLRVTLPVVQWPDCFNSYFRSKIKVSPSRQICAGGQGNADSCSGDSGGPLQFFGEMPDETTRMIQFGVVSFGSRDCATRNLPSVYSRVGYYMDWILNNLRP